MKSGQIKPILTCSSDDMATVLSLDNPTVRDVGQSKRRMCVRECEYHLEEVRLTHVVDADFSLPAHLSADMMLHHFLRPSPTCSSLKMAALTDPAVGLFYY